MLGTSAEACILRIANSFVPEEPLRATLSRSLRPLILSGLALVESKNEDGSRHYASLSAKRVESDLGPLSAECLTKTVFCFAGGACGIITLRLYLVLRGLASNAPDKSTSGTPLPQVMRAGTEVTARVVGFDDLRTEVSGHR
jgi:hypothetical protein